MAPGTAGAEGKSYAVVFDPLDGSRNVECNIPVGSIFGVYEHDEALGVLRPGRDLVAAGYVLYSSSCLLVLTRGDGVDGFTLDREAGEFVLTHPDLRVRERGQIYSVNDARYWDWPQGLRDFIDAIRRGEGTGGGGSTRQDTFAGEDSFSLLLLLPEPFLLLLTFHFFWQVWLPTFTGRCCTEAWR